MNVYSIPLHGKTSLQPPQKKSESLQSLKRVDSHWMTQRLFGLCPKPHPIKMMLPWHMPLIQPSFMGPSECHLKWVQNEAASLCNCPHWLLARFPYISLKVGVLLAPGSVSGRPGRWWPEGLGNDTLLTETIQEDGHPSEHQLALSGALWSLLKSQVEGDPESQMNSRGFISKPRNFILWESVLVSNL